MKFVKMQGCGNDYIYFDCRGGEFKNPGAVSVKLSDRHFGIGGDGIVLICASNIADAKMRMFNADGSEGKMCGNAIRCVAKYLFDSGAVKENCTVETLSGMKKIKVLAAGKTATGASVDMGAPLFAGWTTENGEWRMTDFNKKTFVINSQLTILDYKITCVNMGNPHCVIFVDDVLSFDVEGVGSKFEKNKVFPEGVNTEFVEVINRKTLRMRVWERGSGETLACGTGACAAVVAATVNGLVDKGNVEVLLAGGKLTINYGETVIMTGDAVEVFSGEITA